VDQRVDIWAVGCLLYHCAFYFNPFDREIINRGGSMKMAILNGNYHFDSVVLQENYYSDQFLQLIKSLIKVNSGERPFIDEVIHKIHSISGKSVKVDL